MHFNTLDQVRQQMYSSFERSRMALPLVVFFALQRYFVRGILAGSVKG